MSLAATQRRRSYHVGNVRAQLLAAARELLDESGPTGLSLRAIADRAGVAPGTVYYYHADKAALLGDLAADGFRQLAETMRAAYAERDGQTGLQAIGGAYLTFVREKPQIYELMYQALEAERSPEVAAAEAFAFSVARAAIVDDFSVVHGPERSAQIADAIWAWGRGIAAISLSRSSPGRGPQHQAVDSAVEGLKALLGGR